MIWGQKYFAFWFHSVLGNLFGTLYEKLTHFNTLRENHPFSSAIIFRSLGWFLLKVKSSLINRNFFQGCFAQKYVVYFFLMEAWITQNFIIIRINVLLFFDENYIKNLATNGPTKLFSNRKDTQHTVTNWVHLSHETIIMSKCVVSIAVLFQCKKDVNGGYLHRDCFSRIFILK